MTAKLAIPLLALLAGISPPPAPDVAATTADDPDLVRVVRQTVAYRAAGEFSVGGRTVNGLLSTVAVARAFSIMRAQVTRGDYDACVAAGACRKLATAAADPALPATGVSWHDATAFAAWRTRATGRYWRLPTDIEWALAAGSRYRDDAVALDAAADTNDPAQRWLADYAGSGDRPKRDAAVRPIGGFGRNEYGLDDLAGNVWEWTSTCFARQRVDPASGKTSTIENCGVRVAEGLHRAYVQAFFRDPKGGACSVGVPPIHLGLRLVRDDGPPPREVVPATAEQLLANL